MKPLVAAMALVFAFTGLGYVRRELQSARAAAYLVAGSRDRALRGKARVRARRAR